MTATPFDLLALFAPNPASHAVWWVAGAIAIVMVLMPLIDGLFWLRDRYRSWRAGDAEPSTAAPGDMLHVGRLGGELRRRYHHRVKAYRRTWHEGRPNEPQE